MMDLKRSYCDTSPPAAAVPAPPQGPPSMSPHPPQYLFSQEAVPQGVYAFQGAPAPAPPPATSDAPALSNGPVSPKKSMSKANALMRGLKISSDPAGASTSDATVASQPRRAPNASSNLGKTKKRSPKAAGPTSAPPPEGPAVPSEAGALGDAAGPSGAGAPEQAAPPSRRARPPPRRQRNKRNENDTKPNIPNHRIIITGFPAYTTERELVAALRRHGLQPAVELAAGGAQAAGGAPAPAARATFTTDAEAYAALLASGKVDVNGHFVELRPHNEHYLKAEERGGRRRGKRQAFPKSKEKYEIVQPAELELSGSFEQQLERVLASIRLTQEEVDRVQLLYQDLQDALRQEWPDCVALPFGSITTGLGIKSSDADCFIALAGLDDQGQALAPAQPQPPGNPVGRAKRLLQQRPDAFAEVLAIPRANTPIVKCYHLRTRTACDVSFKTPLGVRNSRLLAHLLCADPRLLPLAVLLKYWARVQRLSGSGRLTNYALVLMLLFYLQRPARRLLPPVAALQRDPAHERLVDGWNTGFDDAPLPPADDGASVADLAGGFFEYYATFPFHAAVVCPYLGEAVPKAAFHEPSRLPAEFERYRRYAATRPGLRAASALCVQDPFEQCHNVTSGVPSRLFADIKEHVKFAAAAYRESRARACDTFLRRILLEAPESVAAKRFRAEYEVPLADELLESIAADDWREPLRGVALAVFQRMLLLELAGGSDGYTGNVTKPIWKRRRGELADDGDDVEGLVAREAQITEEIVKSDRPPVHIEFGMELRTSDAPRRASVAVRLKRGNVKAFKEFGRFLMYHDFWFGTLLRPHLRRGARARAGGAGAARARPASPPPDADDSASDDELVDFDEDEERKTKAPGDDSADSKEESGGSDSSTDSEGAPSRGGADDGARTTGVQENTSLQ